MHDVDFRGGHAQGEGVVAVGRGAAHDIVRRCRSLAQDNEHLGYVGLLDGVDQALAQAQQFGLLGDVAHVDAAGVLEPDDRDAVAAAQGDELVHLDQTLAVELAADARIIGVFRVVRLEETLAVADGAHQETVQLHQPV